MFNKFKGAIFTMVMAATIATTSQVNVYAQETTPIESTVSTEQTAAEESTQTAAETTQTAATTQTSSKSTKTTAAKKVKKSKKVYKKTKYAKKTLAIRVRPSSKSKKLMKVKVNKKMKAGATKKGWTAVKVNNKVEGYAKAKDLSKKKIKKWKGAKLNRSNGVVTGPSGERETYYNLRMNRVVRNMKRFGYSKKDYKVRKDGVKTLDGYVMIATDWSKYPQGTFVNTTLGLGLVCDECPSGGIDIAVTW